MDCRRNRVYLGARNEPSLRRDISFRIRNQVHIRRVAADILLGGGIRVILRNLCRSDSAVRCSKLCRRQCILLRRPRILQSRCYVQTCIRRVSCQLRCRHQIREQSASIDNTTSRIKHSDMTDRCRSLLLHEIGKRCLGLNQVERQNAVRIVQTNTRTTSDIFDSVFGNRARIDIHLCDGNVNLLTRFSFKLNRAYDPAAERGCERVLRLHIQVAVRILCGGYIPLGLIVFQQKSINIERLWKIMVLSIAAKILNRRASGSQRIQQRHICM